MSWLQRFLLLVNLFCADAEWLMLRAEFEELREVTLTDFQALAEEDVGRFLAKQNNVTILQTAKFRTLHSG